MADLAVFDRLFPWFMDNVFGKGFRPEVARGSRQCMLALDHTEQNPRMCLANHCMSWRWNRSKLHWRGLFTKRRGMCDHSMARRHG